LPQVSIPSDSVDVEQLARPRPWNFGEIQRYSITPGPLSSNFEYTTYAVMWFVFHTTTVGNTTLFQTGWFVASLMTQTLIIHVIRANNVPSPGSHPGLPMIATTVMNMHVGVWLPVSPLATARGFVALPALVLAAACADAALLRRAYPAGQGAARSSAVDLS
jgi:Mg2+-importing ATPase